ncbi:MAG TPA: transglycosylase SLT domain-containing protein [Gammaproteobacteria bacterium]|nr:transglycosylase SLT domain-containing protein [Gammaproteobacteria bacterium]
MDTAVSHPTDSGMEYRWWYGRRSLAALLILLMGVFNNANAGAETAQLALYGQARARLAAGDLAGFQQLETKLRSFPLYPYLQYAAIQRDFTTVPDQTVEQFLSRYPQLPITPLLRTAWLRQLGRRQDWSTLLADYRGEQDVVVRCFLAQAQAATGHKDEALAQAKSLWRVGYAQPASCDATFELLANNGALTPDLVRQRLLLMLGAGHVRLADYLIAQLPGPEQPVASAWVTVYRDPGRSLTFPPAALGEPAQAQQALEAAFTHAATQDPAAAHVLWGKVAARYGVDAEVRARVDGSIALYAAYDELPQAERWLARLPPASTNDIVRAWRVRNALRAGDWRTVVKAIAVMPQAQRDQDAWCYWDARALDALGNGKQARARFRQCARRFSYYGFLAADAIGAPYYWGDAIPSPDPARQAKVRNEPGAVRALLLHRADQPADAQREWRALVRGGLDDRAQLAAARVAAAAHWPWAAMYAAASAGVRNASGLIFPLGYLQEVRTSSARSGIPAPWLLAMIRRESAFKPGVCSHAGACGLMQLIPGTAQSLYRRIEGQDAAPLETLSEPGQNIALGSRYLGELKDRFGSLVIAGAAYNAGPARVATWVVGGPAPGSARWIETLPYGETREYLQAVLFNKVVYELRLTGDTSRITTILHENVYASSAPSRPVLRD